MSMLEIRGGGLVIRGGPSPSAETGLFVGRDGLQGWQGLPARRREAMVRALSDGEFDVPVRLPARVITIDPGVILARSEYDLQRWCDQVNGWGATGAPFDLTVEHLGQTLTASVRVIAAEGEDSQRRAGGFLRGSWSAQLVASDPRKFSTELRRYPVPTPFVGVPVPSRGNFPAHPVVEIADAPTSYSVGSPGGVFAVTGVPAGGTHRIDLASGRVTRNGVWLPNAGRGALWAIPAGESWDVSLTTPGTVLIRDTYV